MILENAIKILKDNNIKVIKEAMADEETHILTVYLKHTTINTADMRTKSGRRVYHINARKYGLTEASEYIGGKTIGSNRYDVDTNFSWTWIDVNGIANELKKYGIDITEQHGQAKITREVNDEPVADGGHYGAYGENSNSIYYFETITERTWQLKMVGSSDSWDKLLDDEDPEQLFKEIVENNMPGIEKDSGDGYENRYIFK